MITQVVAQVYITEAATSATEQSAICKKIQLDTITLTHKRSIQKIQQTYRFLTYRSTVAQLSSANRSQKNQLKQSVSKMTSTTAVKNCFIARISRNDR